MRWPQRTSQQQHGSATVLAVVLSLVLSTVAVAGAVLGGVLVASREAAAAADLAALAAAEMLPSFSGGSGDSGGSTRSTGSALAPSASIAPGAVCARARAISAANGARLRACRVVGDEVTVRVTVDVHSVLGITVAVPGRARAGLPRSVGSA